MHTSHLRADRHLLLFLFILMAFGLVALLSASTPIGFAKFNDSYFFVKKQIIFGLLPGLLLFTVLAKVDYRNMGKFSWLLYAVSILLLLLVFIPGIGVVINHSRSWLNIAGISFQPSELTKLAVVIMLAHFLTEKKLDWSDWRTSLLPTLALIAPAFLLVLAQPDVGTLSILAMIVFVMFYLANVPSKYLAMLGAAAIVSFIILVMAAPYRAGRLTTFLHPELDPKGVGYQVNQAFLAVGSGGWWGLGFGHSRQKFQYLPEVNADSIFAIIAEENGFFISLGVIILFLLIARRGFFIAKRAPDEFGYLLVSGIMVWLVWQSFLNIGATVGALPLTGVPLPFISHGGSALMMLLAAMGIVANVSKFSKI